jgi:hypothetical protein
MSVLAHTRVDFSPGIHHQVAPVLAGKWKYFGFYMINAASFLY